MPRTFAAVYQSPVRRPKTLPPPPPRRGRQGLDFGRVVFVTQMRYVQWLDLTDNAIQIIPNLDKYTALEGLELARNKISRISTTAFKKLTRLKYLDLSHNSFTDWAHINPKILLQTLLRLKTLKFSHNNLAIFTGKESQMRVTSSSLEDLQLSSCGIRQFDGKALMGFKRLQNLDLSFNRIKWMDDLSSPTLTTLDVSYCDIDSMNPNALRNLPFLTTLKLSGNTQFAVNHGNLTSESLQVFEAAYCSLTMPGLHGFPNLTYANLRGNKIVTLKERTFLKNKFLVELDLSANEIRDIHPQAFIAARELAFVNLSTNSLQGTLPWNAFSTNYNLKTLDLSVNRLQSVGNLSILMLENLDLSQCQIREISKDSLTGLPWLAHLNLSHNPLENIPDNIQSWNLRDLDLSYCRLSLLTNETFKRFPEIGSINLIGNRFINPFKINMFDYNDRLDSLKLADNPWICDCYSESFKIFWEFLTNYPVKVTQSEQGDIKCMSPDSLAGKSWIKACHQVWYPSDEAENSFGLTHYGTALLILIITAAGIFAIVGGIKHSIKKRMKEEHEEIQSEMGRTYETHSRVEFQQRENFDFGTPGSPELRPPRTTERERSESQATQPPTYEEAMEMLSGSREDIVSRAGVEDSVDSEQDNDSMNSNSETIHSGEYSVGSDDSDDERGASKPLSKHTK
ncbi:Leucine-rich repeat-containing protein 15 [Zootermopsis nevadensis]|uniref:Leucine-rich repeat-containing protein 15 n=1 Tax=Zootermopsis nevadensis TaxID=136037 RepID=A0A067R328_ZOONE|nr:Leucine-rich repeat-containing protein 15 [Zootermopsis nevadensis]